MAKKNQVSQANVPATEPNEWKTLHIFGYGETQLIDDVKIDHQQIFTGGGELPKIVDNKVSTSTLTKAQALIDFVYSKKPADSDAGVEFHAITIVRDFHCVYVPKNVAEKHFRIEYKDMDAKLIQDLVSELQAI
jgi:hypothetical protein